MKIGPGMTTLQLIEEMGKSGVLGAGRMYRATELLAEVISDEETTVFLSIAGPMVPGGLRKIIRDLIADGHVDVVITSGANLTHDLLETFGGSHYREHDETDEELCQMGMGRIGDVYTKAQDFEVFEKKISTLLEEIAQKNNQLNIREFITEIGNSIQDPESIICTAAEKNVPIYAPGLIDSMLGLQLWMFTQENQLTLDAPGDMHELSDIVYSSKKVATVILGGGLPKHYALASNILTGGVDAAIQVTLDRSEAGSLGGAPLEEAKSWAKAKCGSKLVTVIGDATIIFPLMVAGAREKLDK
ncbi:deoxyhypusine synthase Dys [Methanobacterium formicicum]|jgi:deoxyhypusine synthase|uniref:Deoxyhypusine synthase Dys n=2 Tax=Methanobacterium formicicum TaxID=2162 RepID=A0A089ZGR4_METFO|nr:deoxyhypusine synthase [Methanobacterium formicicum]AIS32350.1 deoxyhypusine synthase Dys [Methanobacterium formicicum]